MVLLELLQLPEVMSALWLCSRVLVPFLAVHMAGLESRAARYHLALGASCLLALGGPVLVTWTLSALPLLSLSSPLSPCLQQWETLTPGLVSCPSLPAW